MQGKYGRPHVTLVYPELSGELRQIFDDKLLSELQKYEKIRNIRLRKEAVSNLSLIEQETFMFQDLFFPKLDPIDLREYTSYLAKQLAEDSASCLNRQITVLYGKGSLDGIEIKYLSYEDKISFRLIDCPMKGSEGCYLLKGPYLLKVKRTKHA